MKGNIQSECKKLNIWARDEINTLLKIKAISTPEFLGQMSSISIKSNDIIQDQIKFYLKYKIQIPFVKWNDREFFRISIQAYNSKEDIATLLEALQKEYC